MNHQIHIQQKSEDKNCFAQGLVQDTESFTLCSGVKSEHIWAQYQKCRHSLLLVLPEDDFAAKVTEQKCFLCVSQAADATWGKCVKAVTPRALRKTGYRQWPSSALRAFTNVMNASVAEHASLKISQAPGP